MTNFITLIFALIVALALYVIVIYNGMIAHRKRVKNAFSQIEVQLQRRYELISNLVETAKTHLKYERETLEAVAQARNQALDAEQSAAARPMDGVAVEALVLAESVLTQSLERLLAVVENYPELKSDAAVARVMEELSSTQNRVAFARQVYNDAVLRYNTKIESFPGSIVATQFRFKQVALWGDIPAAENALVKASFQ